MNQYFQEIPADRTHVGMENVLPAQTILNIPAIAVELTGKEKIVKLTRMMNVQLTLPHVPALMMIVNV